MGGPLEGDVVVHVSEPLRRERALGQWQVGDDEQIQDVVAVHEHDLRPLSRVEPLPEPVLGLLSDPASRDDESMVHQHTPTRLRIEYLVPQHHCRLIQYLADVAGAALAHARGVQLPLLGLDAEVEDVKRRQGLFHPHVFAVLQRLVLVASGGDPVEAELEEQREQHLFDQFILGAFVEVGK